MDLHLATRALAAARIAIGLALFISPRRAARGWLGRDADRAGAQAAIRGLGARDVALGVGLLAASGPGPLAASGPGDERRDLHRWLEAGIVADLADAAGTLLMGRPDRSRATVVGVAASGVLLGGWLRAKAD